MTAPDQHMQQRLAEADRALAGGNLPQARELLESLVSANPQVPAFWHRLATVRRMAGEPRGALVAIDRALGIVPLDFVGLLVRAALLDQLGDGEAGELMAALSRSGAPIRCRRCSCP